MRNRKLLILCLLLILLAGCQLARADGMTVQSERLIGAFITREYLDLFDFEGYLEDNISTFEKGGNITIENSERYNGRIYAELREVPLTNEETGAPSVTWEYEFPDLDGIDFFAAEVILREGVAFRDMQSDNAISDAKYAAGNVNSSLEGTIHFEPNDELVFYVNPVYQDSDGRVYVTTGNGMVASGRNQEGWVFSTTLEEQQTVAENGEITAEGFKLTVHFAVRNPPQGVGIIQMDAGNEIVARDDYDPNELPERIEPEGETEYIIAETRAAAPDGGTIVTREIFDVGDDYITAYTAYVGREDGIVEARLIELLWK